jgi:hypothetical protein
VADLLSNIRKVREIVGLFDVDIFTDRTIGIFPVTNSDATDVAKDLEKIFTSLEIPSKSGRGIGITFSCCPVECGPGGLLDPGDPGQGGELDQGARQSSYGRIEDVGPGLLRAECKGKRPGRGVETGLCQGERDGQAPC